MKRVIVLAATTGYQTRSFGEAAERLGVELVYGTDRCHLIEDPWQDQAIPIRFHDEDASVSAILDVAKVKSFDGVIAVGDRPTLIAALRDALSPDGRLIVEVFNGALLSGRYTETKDPGILTAYSEKGLVRLLEQNGLLVEHLSGATLRHRGIRGLLHAMAQALWFRLYRLILILERGRDDELPRIGSKTIIAVARRR